MSEPRISQSHRIIGGELCLDFANTVNGHTRPDAHEYLHDFEDLILWGQHAGLLKSNEADTLLREAARRPNEAEKAFRRGIELRETIFRIATALIEDGDMEDRDLETLNATWKERQQHLLLIRTENGIRPGWDDEPSLDSVLRVVAESAIQFLTSPKVRLLRRCSGERCDWLFVDTSRNHLRRWCSMDECGNRAKMQRRQSRQRLILNG